MIYYCTLLCRGVREKRTDMQHREEAEESGQREEWTERRVDREKSGA
jgi:hypothetical protein